jgi:hypothetical protein
VREVWPRRAPATGRRDSRGQVGAGRRDLGLEHADHREAQPADLDRSGRPEAEELRAQTGAEHRHPARVAQVRSASMRPRPRAVRALRRAMVVAQTAATPALPVRDHEAVVGTGAGVARSSLAAPSSWSAAPTPRPIPNAARAARPGRARMLRRPRESMARSRVIAASHGREACARR